MFKYNSRLLPGYSNPLKKMSSMCSVKKWDCHGNTGNGDGNGSVPYLFIVSSKLSSFLNWIFKSLLWWRDMCGHLTAPGSLVQFWVRHALPVPVWVRLSSLVSSICPKTWWFWAYECAWYTLKDYCSILVNSQPRVYGSAAVWKSYMPKSGKITMFYSLFTCVVSL